MAITSLKNPFQLSPGPSAPAWNMLEGCRSPAQPKPVLVPKSMPMPSCGQCCCRPWSADWLPSLTLPLSHKVIWWAELLVKSHLLPCLCLTVSRSCRCHHSACQPLQWDKLWQLRTCPAACPMLGSPPLGSSQPTLLPGTAEGNVWEPLTQSPLDLGFETVSKSVCCGGSITSLCLPPQLTWAISLDSRKE